MAPKRTTPEVLGDLIEAIDADQAECAELRVACAESRAEVRAMLAEVRELVTLTRDDRVQRRATEAAEGTAIGWLTLRVQDRRLQFMVTVIVAVIAWLTGHNWPAMLPQQQAPQHAPAPAPADTPPEPP